jgi:outer membrane protein assembly factor BamB
LHALNLESGEEVWQTPHPGCNDVPGCGPAQSAAVTAITGIVFSGGIDGHLRAYSSDDGRIVWDVDTKREYRTVNGVAARGGGEQALRLYTSAASHYMFEEDKKGSIEPGKLADLAVLSADPVTVPENQIKDIVVDLTVVDGKVVFQR